MVATRCILVLKEDILLVETPAARAEHGRVKHLPLIPCCDEVKFTLWSIDATVT